MSFPVGTYIFSSLTSPSQYTGLQCSLSHSISHIAMKSSKLKLKFKSCYNISKWHASASKQDRHCRYKCNQRHIYIITVVMEVLNIMSVSAAKVSKEHLLYYTVICGLFGSTIFFHIISYRHNFQKNLCIKYVFFLCNSHLKHLILRITQQNIIINVHRSSRRALLFLPDSENCNFLNMFLKNTET